MPFVNNTGKDSALYVDCSVLPGDRALSQFISDPGKDSAVHIPVQVSLETEPLSR